MSATFTKYPSIENCNKEKYIQYTLNKYPDLNHCNFMVQEKIDGANIQLKFTKRVGNHRDTPFSLSLVQVGRRTGHILPGEKFFDIFGVLKKYEDNLARIQNYIDSIESPDLMTLTIYGELFGKGINNRVNYGPDRYILFFDCFRNDIMRPFYDLCLLLAKTGNEDLCVPVIKFGLTLDEAINFDSQFITKVNKGDNHNMVDSMCEGIVIKPYDKRYPNFTTEHFCLKKVNDDFKDFLPRQKVNGDNSEKVKELHQIFSTIYVCENRAISLISKEGPIKSKSQVGHYIKLLYDDAQKDFLKDYDQETQTLSPKELHYIFNVKSQGYNLLVKFIQVD